MDACILDQASDRTHEALASLAWGTELRALGAYSSIDTLAVLLSDDCLDPVLRTEVIVAPLAFQNALKVAHKKKTYGDKAGPLLKRSTEIIGWV